MLCFLTDVIFKVFQPTNEYCRLSCIIVFLTLEVWWLKAKTYILITSPHPVAQFPNSCCSCVMPVSEKKKKTDSSSHFYLHITEMFQSCFFNLGNILKISPILSSQHRVKPIHAFVTSWLNYCNALFALVTQSSLKCLQLEQTFSARLNIKL